MAALITCPDCQRSISPNATACPNCGRPMKADSIADTAIHGRGEGIFMKGMNCGCVIVGLMIVLGILGSS